MPQFRGMTWSHPRGLAPLRAASDAFAEQHPGTSVSWDARSLQEFEDVPVTELAERYDLIAIDHPFVGQAAASRALVPLDELLPPEVLADLRTNSVGPSYRSYTMAGHQWALPMDAAAPVTAYRPDLLPGPAPRTWEEAFALLVSLPAGTVAELPANPTHLWSCFVSLCHYAAGDGESRATRPDGRPAWWAGEGIEPEVGHAAFGHLLRLLALVDPASFSRDPITTLDAMAAGAPIAYAPLVFGYSNYARDGFGKHLVRFSDAPSGGTMIGGVGLAVSTRCADIEAAAALARWVVSPECQTGVYVASAGQPAHRTAWTDTAANELTHDFFSGTLATLDASFVRGRAPGYPEFQRRGGELLHEGVRSGRPPSPLLDQLAALWRELCPAEDDAS